MNETKTNDDRIEIVAASKLRVHPVAQRALIPAHLKYLKGAMDLDAIGTVHAVEYAINSEIALWVVDGQHRIVALNEMGLGDWPVLVQVHARVKDDQRAAALFLELNKRRVVGAYDRYDKEVKAGQSPAVNVSMIVRSEGLRVGPTATAEALSCVESLKRIYNLDRGQALQRALGITVKAWGRTVTAKDGKLLEGLGRLCAANNGKIDEAALIQKLAKFPGGPAALMGSARGVSDLKRLRVPRAVAEVIADTYNKGRRTEHHIRVV